MRLFLSLGSNKGADALKKGLNKLCERYPVIGVSSLYVTEPWGNKNLPLFYNAVSIHQSKDEPEEILCFIKTVEKKQMGRWKPRELDIDIIFYEDLVYNSRSLVIPHPRAHLRRFVMEPLFEISPDFVHPVLKVSIRTILTESPYRNKVIGKILERIEGWWP